MIVSRIYCFVLCSFRSNSFHYSHFKIASSGDPPRRPSYFLRSLGHEWVSESSSSSEPTDRPEFDAETEVESSDHEKDRFNISLNETATRSHPIDTSLVSLVN